MPIPMVLVDEFLKDLSQVIHVHLHDNKGRSDEHLSLGKGTIDWKKVIKKLDGYKGRVEQRPGLWRKVREPEANK